MMKQKLFMVFALALAASLVHANPEFYGVAVPSQQDCAQMGYIPMHLGDSLNLSNGARLLNGGVWRFLGSVYTSFYGYTPDSQRLDVPFMEERPASIAYPGGFEANISACGLPYYPDGSVYDSNNSICTENCSIYVKLAEYNQSESGNGSAFAAEPTETCAEMGFQPIAIGQSIGGQGHGASIFAYYDGYVMSFGGVADFRVHSQHIQNYSWNSTSGWLPLPSYQNATYVGGVGQSLTLQMCGYPADVVYLKSHYYDPADCVSLSTAGQTLVLGNDSNFCYNVSANDVEIDCAGHALRAFDRNLGSCGITSDASGTRIKNCQISGFSSGICLQNASGAILENNSISNTSAAGISLFNTSSSTLEGNSLAQGNGAAIVSGYDEVNATILLVGSSNNILSNNTAFCNGCTAISIANGSGNTLFANFFSALNRTALIMENSSGNRFIGNTLNSSVDTKETVNINGTIHPLIAWESWSSWSGGIGAPVSAYLLHSNSSQFSGNAFLSQTQDALLLAESSDGVFYNNSFSALGGLLLAGKSNGNDFRQNLFNSSGNYSMAIQGMPYTPGNPRTLPGDHPVNNSFTLNTIIAPNDAAIFFWHFDYLGGTQASNNSFCENNITSRVWVSDRAGNDTNVYSCRGKGNIYYFGNGTPSWDVYDIVDTNNDSYADIGSDLPFTQSTVGDYWHGPSEDAHPYTLKQGAPQAIAQNSSAGASAPNSSAMNATGMDLPPAPPSDAVSLPQANATAAEPAMPTNSTGAAAHPLPSPSLLDEILASFLDFLKSLNKI